MTKNYIIADNAVRIAVEDDLPAWEMIEARYYPFAAPLLSTKVPVLDVDIKCTPIPECDAEPIYKPTSNEIGPMIATVARAADGSYIMDFIHESESKPRIRMKMPADLSKADIILAPVNMTDDHYFLTHALMIAFMLASSVNGSLLIHASCVVCDGKAYLFQGKSGTGKSTHARLWLQNIEGARLLNDDNPVIRFSAEGEPTAYGSPWSGKTPCYRNLSYPIGGFVRIVRSADNELRPLPPLNAYASLTTSMFYMPFVSEQLKTKRHKTIERLAMTVPCYEMHCRPDADAALTCKSGIS